MKPREGRWWHQDVSAGEGETPGEPVAWLSLSHGHSHEHRDVTSAATSSTGLSTALWGWFIFSLADPAAKILKQVRHMGSWHEQTRLAPAQIYKEFSYHFIFFFFSTPLLFQLQPNPKHKLHQPGSSWRLQLLNKIDFFRQRCRWEHKPGS